MALEVSIESPDWRATSFRDLLRQDLELWNRALNSGPDMLTSIPSVDGVLSQASNTSLVRYYSIATYATGQLVGSYRITHSAHARSGVANICICVDVPYQGQGAGNALLEHALQTLDNNRDFRATDLVTTIQIKRGTDSEALKFCLARGFSEARRCVVQKLTLSGRHHSSPSISDFTIETARSFPPSEWIVQLAPIFRSHFSLFPPNAHTGTPIARIEQFDAFMHALFAMEPYMFLSVARNKSAEIVGFSYTRSDGFATAYIGDTHVLPEYRHQGIAHALKEANYDALASACPLVREVVTSTDVKNSIMLRVNKSFGFVPVATTVHLRMHIEHGQC